MNLVIGLQKELKLETSTFRTHPERLLKLHAANVPAREKKLAPQKLGRGANASGRIFFASEP